MKRGPTTRRAATPPRIKRIPLAQYSVAAEPSGFARLLAAVGDPHLQPSAVRGALFGAMSPEARALVVAAVVDRSAQMEALRAAISHAEAALSDWEAIILIRRFGLELPARSSQAQVARELGISRQRLGRLERQAIQKLLEHSSPDEAAEIAFIVGWQPGDPSQMSNQNAYPMSPAGSELPAGKPESSPAIKSS